MKRASFLARMTTDAVSGPAAVESPEEHYRRGACGEQKARGLGHGAQVVRKDIVSDLIP